MKEEKAKYLLVESSDLLKKVYEIRRESGFNDNWNVALSRKFIEAREVFNYFNVPDEYQNIIIGIRNGLFKKRVEEFITNYNFDKYNVIKSDRIIEASISYEREQTLGFMGWQPLYDRIKFNTELNYHNYLEVLYYLKSIDDSGYLKQYIDAINNIFINKVYYNNRIYNVFDDEIALVKEKILKINK